MKGYLESFWPKNAQFSSYKLFSRAITDWDEKSTKTLYSSSTVYFGMVAEN